MCRMKTIKTFNRQWKDRGLLNEMETYETLRNVIMECMYNTEAYKSLKKLVGN